MRNKIIPLTVLSLLIPTAFGNAILNVKGRLTSITETEYVVETKTKIYKIEKTAVSPAREPKSIALKSRLPSQSLPAASKA